MAKVCGKRHRHGDSDILAAVRFSYSYMGQHDLTRNGPVHMHARTSAPRGGRFIIAHMVQ